MCVTSFHLPKANFAWTDVQRLCQVFNENLTCSIGSFAEGKFCMDRCSTRKGGKTMAIVREIVRIEYDRITSVSAY